MLNSFVFEVPFAVLLDTFMLNSFEAQRACLFCGFQFKVERFYLYLFALRTRLKGRNRSRKVQKDGEETMVSTIVTARWLHAYYDGSFLCGFVCLHVA